ncbi:vacuolar protein sorting-associated protein 37D isoform X4 [Lemur catta]|uniref:vacuolar protein sorting-associated protein 37D isoform X4 n=1 Tax=Lemur catta TaxID=9447 RepID=UPI001E26E7F0|nr:vacuolar protein sorting-associated protein 37D isoform X4 [Lemur catta]
MYRARAARAGPEPGSPGRFGILSTGQLRDLLQDEPKLDRIVRLSRKFQGLQLEREACLASNYALAKENLALRPRLEMGRAALAIKYQELREVAENCADKLQRLEESTHRWSPHCALGWLQAELEEAEQEAEAWEPLLREAYPECLAHRRAWNCCPHSPASTGQQGSLSHLWESGSPVTSQGSLGLGQLGQTWCWVGSAVLSLVMVPSFYK